MKKQKAEGRMQKLEVLVFMHEAQHSLSVLPSAICFLPSVRRRGSSLLEVMFAIFIVAVGLISIASLLPVGSIQLEKAGIEERKACLGVNALREFQIRGFANPNNWVRENAAPYLPLVINPANFFLPDGAWVPPLVIDPQMLARTVIYDSTNPSNALNGTIDVTARNELQFFPIYRQPSGSPPVIIHRISLIGMLRTFATTNDRSIAQKLKALSEAVFTGADDAITSQPEELSQPGTGTMIQDPSTASPIKRSYEGLYSWIAMLTSVFPSPIPIAIAPSDQFTLTIVVFHRRTLPQNPTPSIPFDNSIVGEDMVTVLQSPTQAGTVSISGGEIQISNPTELQIDYARPGHWLMLCRNDITVGRITSWYRIVTAGVDSSTGNLDMTLSGPDWTWGDKTNYPTYACLFDGAVGVYQRVIHLDGQSVWSQ